VAPRKAANVRILRKSEMRIRGESAEALAEEMSHARRRERTDPSSLPRSTLARSRSRAMLVGRERGRERERFARAPSPARRGAALRVPAFPAESGSRAAGRRRGIAITHAHIGRASQAADIRRRAPAGRPAGFSTAVLCSLSLSLSLSHARARQPAADICTRQLRRRS